MTPGKSTGGSLSAWKTLFLGGILGFVLAFAVVDRDVSGAISNGNRWLAETSPGITAPGSLDEKAEEGVDMVCRLVC